MDPDPDPDLNLAHFHHPSPPASHLIFHPSSLTQSPPPHLPYPTSLTPPPSPPSPSPHLPHPSSFIPQLSSLIPNSSSLLPQHCSLASPCSSITFHPSSLTPSPSSLTQTPLLLSLIPRASSLAHHPLPSSGIQIRIKTFWICHTAEMQLVESNNTDTLGQLCILPNLYSSAQPALSLILGYYLRMTENCLVYIDVVFKIFIFA